MSSHVCVKVVLEFAERNQKVNKVCKQQMIIDSASVTRVISLKTHSVN